MVTFLPSSDTVVVIAIANLQSILCALRPADGR
jgi:hypothetical protein